MPTLQRAPLADVLQRIRADVSAQVKAAAGNTQLSEAEAKASGSALIAEAREDVKSKKGWFDVKVGTTEATEAALAIVEKNIAAINQATGSGKGFISQEEIKRLQGVDPESATLAAKAYELITGKRVVLDGNVPGNTSALPQRALVALTDDLVDYLGLARAARLTTKDVTQVDGGYSFKVESNVYTGPAFAREVDGKFIVAGKQFSEADYQNVKQAALDYFDDSFAVEMRDWGSTDAEIADARAKFTPFRAFLPGEDSDPHGLTADYPFVFQIDNETGSDHGVYAGYDPASGGVEVYSFN